FEEKDETYSTYVYKSRSNKYIIIGSSSTLSDEYRILDADSPDGKFKVFQERERGLEYGIGHVDDKFYVITNMNARNFKLMVTDVDKTTKDNWKPFIEHREDVFLEGFLSFKDFIVVHEREKGDQRLVVINHSSNDRYEIDFGDKPYTVWFGQNPEFNTQVIRLGYTSMTIPSSIYDYDLEKRTLELLKQQEVVGGYNADEYTSERVFATASDNTQVPITLVYKKTTAKGKNTPLLLYGYGSYGHTIDPYFSSARLSLLDRGFIYAIAHIRGGQVMGRAWYEDGKMLSKKNTFTDFIACGEYLVEKEYTSKEKIAAMGGSAGGLLTGAVMNLRPDLFKAVIAAVPFVDVVTTMLDESIPLTTGEYDEWGNPNEKEYYDYMLSYSPYDNVGEKDYPNVLVTTGLHDSQVQYWEPAKWVAKLRELKTDDNILLMHTNMDAGHGGASGRFRPYKETATEYAFLIKILDIK
ncbi:MAG: S9 family peptidase, partial [Bacteroidales bacterium]|nr:S9 family peptidase [Bacteroidales bacterium]